MNSVLTEDMQTWLDSNYSESSSLLDNIMTFQSHFNLSRQDASHLLNYWMSEKGD